MKRSVIIICVCFVFYSPKIDVDLLLIDVMDRNSNTGGKYQTVIK